METESLHANVLPDGQVRGICVGFIFFFSLFPHKHNTHCNISGKTCTERITQCYSGQCANGGSCAPTIIGGEATSVCICSNGWGGAFCTEPIDQCQGQPCHNGGTCESGTGWFRCACAQGFSGPDCRINVNECSPQPCLGGATCIDGIGGFTCVCPKGRRGLRCEICKYFNRNFSFHFCKFFLIEIRCVLSLSTIRSIICMPKHHISVTIQCNRVRDARRFNQRNKLQFMHLCKWQTKMLEYLVWIEELLAFECNEWL